MAKYRKKTPIVEAIQFDPHAYRWPQGIHPWKSRGYQPRDGSLGYVEMPNGEQHVWGGEWIILENTGQVHLCNPDLFEQMYEPIDPDDYPLR